MTLAKANKTLIVHELLMIVTNDQNIFIVHARSVIRSYVDRTEVVVPAFNSSE